MFLVYLFFVVDPITLIGSCALAKPVQMIEQARGGENHCGLRAPQVPSDIKQGCSSTLTRFMQISLVPLHTVLDVSLTPWPQLCSFLAFSCSISLTYSRNVCSKASFPHSWSYSHPAPLFLSPALSAFTPTPNLC